MSLILAFIAVSASLPIAWMSISKLLLLASGLIGISQNYFQKAPNSDIYTLWSPRIVCAAIAAFAMGLVATKAPLDIALTAFVKHSKILVTVLFIYLPINKFLISRTVQLWMIGQTIVLMTSYAIAFGIIPLSADYLQRLGPIVFAESYIDQSIMFAISAAVAWHLRNDGMWPNWAGKILAPMFLINILLLLPGRTGYMLVAMVFTLAVYWQIKFKRKMLVVFALPLILFAGLYMSGGNVHNGLNRVVKEIREYSEHNAIETSAGWRLNAWHRSIQAIADEPISGHGTGSWTSTVKKYQGENSDSVFGVGLSSNPHQEFLLWGVELGAVGMLILCAILAGFIVDASYFNESTRHAVITIVACIATAGMFNSILYDDLVGDFICISLGIVFAYGTTTTEKKTESATPSI
jgi:O-antigen ligase